MLAAGHSRRFGPEDKLLASFRGAPVVAHAAEAMRHSEVDHLIAVVATDAVREQLGGFEAVEIRDEGHSQSDSLRAGIARAVEVSADRVLVALGDMPLVTSAMLNEVLARAGETGLSAVTDGTRRMPPACFPKAGFAELLALEGDRGAGAVLRRIPEASLVRVDAADLVDIDLPSDLNRVPDRR